MEGGRGGKQMKLTEPPPSQKALNFIARARNYNPNGTRWPSTEELIEWDALDVVNINIVFCEADLVKPKCTFHPKLAHQIFGQKEKMMGYIFPRIDIYFLANSGKCYLKFTHEGICNRQTDMVNARMFDNLMCWLPPDFVIEENLFIDEIKIEDHFKMYGTELDRFQLRNLQTGLPMTIILRQCSLDEPGFAECHARFQCLLVWYIDAVSQIDLEDSNWMFVYAYEEINMPHMQFVGYYPVGFCAIYKFYHYPDKIRARISQCFVLPCCQKMGLGYQLLTATYKIIRQLENVVDITVEDPCVPFQRIRDTVDTHLLRQLDSYQYSELAAGFSKAMLDDATGFYKINKRQCRRVYHILNMAYALFNGDKEDSIVLLKDMEVFLGIPQKKDKEKAEEKGESSQEVTSTSVDEGEVIVISPNVEKYVTELRPVARNISKILKAENPF